MSVETLALLNLHILLTFDPPIDDGEDDQLTYDRVWAEMIDRLHPTSTGGPQAP